MSQPLVEKLFSLDSQVAVVIGGTGVLGGSFCEAIAGAGARVVVAGRSAERGADRVRAIEEAGGEACYLPVDATSRESIEQLLAATLEKYGRCDMLVNSAGVNSADPYFESGGVEFDEKRRPRTGPVGRAGELSLSRIFSGRTEP